MIPFANVIAFAALFNTKIFNTKPRVDTTISVTPRTIEIAS